MTVEAENWHLGKSNIMHAVHKVSSDKDSGIIVALQVENWMAREDMAITKYQSLMDLLSRLNYPSVGELKCGKTLTYHSDKSAVDTFQSLAHVIPRQLDNKLLRSSFVSL